MSTAPSPLTAKQTETALQAFTLSVLGLDPLAYDRVRVGWQQQGQPAEHVGEDVVYVRCVEDDDEYNRQRDFQYQPYDDANVLERMTYVRVWRTFWVIYGPNSFDMARRIHSKLFRQTVHDQFTGANLYFVTDASAPRRVPEYFMGQWWERVDFEAQFNEGVVEEETMQTVLSSEVIVETENGIVADIVVTATEAEQIQQWQLEVDGGSAATTNYDEILDAGSAFVPACPDDDNA